MSYTSSDATSGVSEVQVYVSGPTDGGTYSLAHTFTGSGLTSGSFTYTATEGDGSYEFETQATDAAGNVETTHASADTTTVEDTVAPTVTLNSVSSPTSNTTPTFSGTAGTASGDLSTITVDVYSGASATGSPVESLDDHGQRRQLLGRRHGSSKSGHLHRSGFAERRRRQHRNEHFEHVHGAVFDYEHNHEPDRQRAEPVHQRPGRQLHRQHHRRSQWGDGLSR